MVRSEESKKLNLLHHKKYYQEHRTEILVREKKRINKMTEQELEVYRARRRIAVKKYDKTHRIEVNERKRKYYANNLEKMRKMVRDSHSRNKNPFRMKMKNLKYHFGISFDDYDNLWIEQMGICPVCKSSLPYMYSAAVDHNHITKEVRGLLHNECNSAIGFLKDNPYLLRNAADYLEGTA